MYTMSAAIKCALLVNRFLNSGPQCVKIISIRHYPRWTHRRPVGIVEENSSPDEWEKWKLKIENEIREDSSNKSNPLETTNSAHPHSEHDSISNITLRESVTGKSYANQKGNSEGWRTRDDAKNAEIHYRREYYQMQHKATPTGGPDDSTWNVKSNLKNVSSRYKTGTVQQKKTPQEPIEKRRIYAEKELEKALKLRESAAKLGVPVFTDLADNDTILSKYLTNVKSQKKREKVGNIMLEGKRLIKDALDAGCIPDAVFFSRIKDLRDLNLPEDKVKKYKIIYKKLCLWSDVTTPQGVIAIMKTPDTRNESPTSLPLTVVLDNIRDPGNLGTILRTCAGVGCKKVILTKGCVDLWEPKVLRAGAGAHFRLPVTQGKDWKEVAGSLDEGSFVCVAENRLVCGPVSYSNNAMDSGSSTSMECVPDGGEPLQSPDRSHELFEHVLAPVMPYYAVNFTSSPSVVLIVGGETEGISYEAYRFVSETSGVRLNIPLSNNVESLNSGSALCVIAFEMKKQFLVNRNTTDAAADLTADDSSDAKVVVKNA